MVSKLPEEISVEEIRPVAVPNQNAQVVGESLASKLLNFGRIGTQYIEEKRNEELQAERADKHLQVLEGIRHIRENILSPQNFNDNALNNYDASVKGFATGILNTTSEKNKRYIENLIQYYGSQSRDIIGNRVGQLSKNKLIANFNEYIDRVGQSAETAYYNGDMIVDDKKNQINKGDILAGQIHQKINTMLSSGLISGAQASSISERLKNRYETSTYLGQFNRALQAGKPQEYIKSFDENKTIDPFLKMNLKSKFIGMLHDYKIEHGFNSFTLRNEMDNAITGVLNGENPSNFQTTINKIIQFAPNEAPDFESRLKTAEYGANLVKSTRWMSLPEAEDIYQKNKPNINDSNYARKFKMWSHIGYMINENYRKAINDPADYIETNPNVLKVKENRLVAASDGFGKLSSQTNASSIDYVGAKLEAEKQMGLPQAIIGNKEAGSFVHSLNGLTHQQQLQRLNNFIMSHAAYVAMRNGTPTTEVNSHYVNIVMKDLYKAKLPIANMMLIGMQNNPQSIRFINDAMNAFDSGKKVLENDLPSDINKNDLMNKVKDELQDYVESTTGYNGASSSVISDAYNHVYLLALKLAQKESGSQAAKDASDALINNNFEYHQVLNHTIRTPPDFSNNLLNFGVKTLRAEAIKSNLAIPPWFEANMGLTDIQRKNDYYSHIFSDGYVETTSDNMGIILVSPSGNPVKTIDGNNFQFSFADMNNPQSVARDKITSLPLLMETKEFQNMEKSISMFGAPNLENEVLKILPHPKKTIEDLLK